MGRCGMDWGYLRVGGSSGLTEGLDWSVSP